MKKSILPGILYMLLATPLFSQWSVDSLINVCANDAVSSFKTKTMFVNYGNWELYDLASQTSTTGLLSLGRNAIKTATIRNITYFGGGQYGPFTDPVYTKNIDVFDFNTNTWTLKKLSKAREVGAATAVGNNILFAGGRDALNMYKTVDIFNVVTGATAVAKLSKARTNITVGVNGGKAVFAGGWYFDINYNRPVSNAVDIYDNTTGTWSTATLSQKRQEITVASVGSKIVFAGGLAGSGVSNKVDIYDVSSNTWSTGTLSAARYDMTVNVIGSKAYFASGGGVSNIVDVYDVNTNTWTVLTMLRNLVSAAGAVINGNEIFYAGGYDATTFTVSRDVQIYNTVTNTWSTAVLSQARAGSNVVSIGRFTIFAGGFTKVTYPATGSTRLDIFRGTSNIPSAVTTFELNVYPNPVGETMKVLVDKNASLPVVLNVYSDKGSLMASFKMESDQQTFYFKSIPSGKYVLSAIDVDGKKADKIIIKQ